MGRRRLRSWSLGTLLAASWICRAADAPRPLFRDPLFDGASEPSVVYHPADKLWYLFYTARRANVPDLEGAAWVQGTPIAVAVSKDGATWRYRGKAQLNDREAVASPTWSSPEVIFHDGLYHLFVTYLPGTFADTNHPRQIVHFTSNDLLQWDYGGVIGLGSLKVSNPTVLGINAKWRMWYTDETDGDAVHWAESDDLSTWTPRGRVTGIPTVPGVVRPFRWHDRYWLLHDTGAGIAVYRSRDSLSWRPAGRLLETPGSGAGDGAIGKGPEIVLSGERAYLYYYTQPGTDSNPRESVIQATELDYDPSGPSLRTDRNRPLDLYLEAPPDLEAQDQLTPG